MPCQDGRLPGTRELVQSRVLPSHVALLYEYCQAMYCYIVLHILLFGHFNAMYTTRPLGYEAIHVVLVSPAIHFAHLSAAHTQASLDCARTSVSCGCHSCVVRFNTCATLRVLRCPLIMHAAAFPKVGKNPSQHRRRRSWLSLPGPRQDEMHRENSESPSLSPSVA